MTDIAVRTIMLRSTSAVSRKQARRFWGAMGAAMRVSSLWLDARGNTRADAVIRRATRTSRGL